MSQSDIVTYGTFLSGHTEIGELSAWVDNIKPCITQASPKVHTLWLQLQSKRYLT